MEATLDESILTSNLSRWAAVAGIVAMAIGAGVLWYFDPTTAGFFPFCPLLRFTGFACPGCGLTRGLHAFLHGDVLTALDFNALIPLFLLIFGYVFASLVSVAVRGRGLMVEKWNLWILWGLLAVMIAFGVLRNLPYYPFTILFP